MQHTLPTVDDPAGKAAAGDIARQVAGDGGLDGLRRLTAAIAAMELSRTQLIGQLRSGPDASWEEIGAACGMTRQGATRRWSKLVHASSFGAAAASYLRGRPGYPQSAVEWLIPRRAKAALDLGAGTGQLTRMLVEAGLTVTAVEPSREMREQLAAAVPEAAVRAGSGEQIPLPDASVDVVTAAQAWHWVDPGRAVPEVARVLVPGGTLSLIWNERDESQPWMALLSAIMRRRATGPVMDTSPRIGPPFGPPERLEVRWRQQATRQDVVDLVASRSYVITLPEADRAELLGEVAELLDGHPDLAGRAEIEVPYVTRCTRVQLR